jgi:aminoglycoside phosphotransferase (APT) family kinase protein
MVTVDELLNEAVRIILTAALGPAVRWQVTPLQVGHHSAVLLVRLSDGQRSLVLKLVACGREHEVDFERTAATAGLARAAGVPVPEVVAVDSSCRKVPYGYLLREHVEGRTWRELHPLLGVDEVAAGHRQLAAAVLALQAVRFDRFGELDRGGRAVGDADLLTALRGRGEQRLPDANSRRLFSAVLDREARLFAGEQQPVLCHDDLHHQNVIFQRCRSGWRLAAIVDWDKSWSGPPGSDVARMAFWDDMTGPAFWEVYRNAVPPTDDEEERATVYQLLWCLEYDVRSERHTADTVALLRRLGLAEPAS